MTTPRRFSVLFRSGAPDQQLLAHAMKAWLADAQKRDPNLTPSSGGQTEFEVIPHFFNTQSNAEFEQCVRSNAQYLFERDPDTMFFYDGIVLWPSEN